MISNRKNYCYIILYTKSCRHTCCTDWLSNNSYSLNVNPLETLLLGKYRLEEVNYCNAKGARFTKSNGISTKYSNKVSP